MGDGKTWKQKHGFFLESPTSASREFGLFYECSLRNPASSSCPDLLGCFFRMLAQPPLTPGLGTSSAPDFFFLVNFVQLLFEPVLMSISITKSCRYPLLGRNGVWCPSCLIRMSSQLVAWWVLGCGLPQSCGGADPNFSTLCWFNDSNRKSIYRQEQIAFLYGEENNSSPVLHY